MFFATIACGALPVGCAYHSQGPMHQAPLNLLAMVASVCDQSAGLVHLQPTIQPDRQLNWVFGISYSYWLDVWQHQCHQYSLGVQVALPFLAICLHGQRQLWWLRQV